MKLHAKDGEVKIEDNIFLPTVKDSEFELDDSDIKSEIVDINEPSWGKVGRYLKVTAPVFVTRYYPVENSPTD